MAQMAVQQTLHMHCKVRGVHTRQCQFSAPAVTWALDLSSNYLHTNQLHVGAPDIQCRSTLSM